MALDQRIGARAPARSATIVALCVLALTVAGCGRADLHGSTQTHAKYNDLNQDSLYTARLDGTAAAQAPLINAGSSSTGPGDSSTNARQQWRSPRFGTDAATASAVITFATKHGIGSFSAPRCSAGLWTIGGLKQYGPWVADVTFSLGPEQVSIDTELGVGDESRQTLAEARARSNYLHKYDPPTISNGCPPDLLSQLKRLAPLD